MSEVRSLNRAAMCAITMAVASPRLGSCDRAACDEPRAVEAVRKEIAARGLDLPRLRPETEGPYGWGAFVHAHPMFASSTELRRTLGDRTFYFVDLVPVADGRGGDVVGLVDVATCEVRHFGRGK